MSFPSLFLDLLPLHLSQVKKEVYLAVLGGGTLLVALSIMIWMRPSSNQVIFPQEKRSIPDLSIESTTQRATVSAVAIPQGIIEVSGAVYSPGVYSFSLEDRVYDMVKKAGGMTKSADMKWVAEHLNQAKKLQDQEKIYIPFKDHLPQEITSNSPLISLNSASMKDLDGLPGIGEKTAQKIIDTRPYVSFQQLLEKKVVSQNTFSQIKELITL